MAGQRITIQIEGEPDGTVRLTDFLAQLQRIKIALWHTERVTADRSVTAKEQPKVYYRIVDLEKKSPFLVVLEEVVSNGHPPSIGMAMVETVSKLQKPGLKTPPVRDVELLESYREMGAPLQKHIAKVTIRTGGTRVILDQDYVDRVTTVIGPDTIEHGSVTGKLEKINFHNVTRFDIFPAVGARRVSCRFPPDLKQQVKNALDNYVTVYGILRYKQWDAFPYAVDVADIEPHPSNAELPTIMDMRGMAPNATGEQSAEDFVRSIRDASW
jgi:hypothetical protein